MLTPNKFVLCLLIGIIQCIDATPSWHEASDGNFYLIEPDQKYNWLQAADLCARQDLQLAVIDSVEKNVPFDALLRKIFVKSPNLWLGHHDEFNKKKSTSRPFYASSTGIQLSFSNWYSGEPKNSLSIEHCAHIQTGFKWNDADCKGKTFGYICEKHQLTQKYQMDLNGRHLKINQNNIELKSAYENTEDNIENIIQNSHNSTNDVLLNFDQSLEEILLKSKDSLKEIVRQKPYLAIIIADVGDVLKNILDVTHKDILSASQDARESIKIIQSNTENSINDNLKAFEDVLSINSNEIDKILSSTK